MGFGFERPIGAGGDVSELEYVSALIQTDTSEIRTDGSLYAEDIALFLNSRYGIRINADEVSEWILEDMGMDGTLDLMQLVAILIIPRLRRRNVVDEEEGRRKDRANTISNDRDDDEDDDFLDYVLHMILHDSFGAADPKPPLTTETLRTIFTSLGESDLASDESLLCDMAQVAGGGNDGSGSSPRVLLDTDTFRRALTWDLGAYDPRNAEKVTTNFCDCMMAATADAPNTTHSKSATTKSPILQPSDDEEVASTPDGAIVNPNKSSTTTTKSDKAARVSLDFTAPFLDLAADTYRSRILLIFLWSSFVVSFFTYYSGFGTFSVLPSCPPFQIKGTFAQNLGTFFCSIGWSIGRWIYILVVMSVYGLTYFGLCGMGNGIENTNPWRPVGGAIFAGIFTVVPPLIPAFRRDGGAMGVFLTTMSVVLGFCVVALNLWQAVTVWVTSPQQQQAPTRCFQRWQHWLVPGSIRGEAMLKQAAMKKADALVENALNLHGEKDENSAIQSHFGQALLNYAKWGNSETERVGGFWWTWKRIRSGELFSSEGIWFPGRMVSINVSQFVIAAFVLVSGLTVTALITNSYDPPTDSVDSVLEQFFELAPNSDNILSIVQEVSRTVSSFVAETTPDGSTDCPEVSDPNLLCNNPGDFDDLEACVMARNTSWFCTLLDVSNADEEAPLWVYEELLTQSGFKSSEVYTVAEANLADGSKTTVDSLYPSEKYMIVVPALFGSLAAFATAIAVALTTIPSLTATTLRLRSGVIGLMHDPKHKTLRIAPDQVAFLQGAMFWGMLLASGLMGVVIGVLFFLILYQNTASIAQSSLAAIIGVIAVVTLHWIMVRSCRFFTSKAFYRKRPLWANAVLLSRECAFFALTVGFTVVRVAKLVFTSILFVGRIDKPFLAPGVGELESLGFRLDNHPYVFLMSVLQTEAHRHPWIEILGVMCVLKLQNGPNFATKAACTWRLMVVLMLMPWLSRYRTLARPSMRDESGKGIMGDGSSNHGVREYRQLRRGESSATSSETMSEVEKMKEETNDLKRQVRMLRQQLLIAQAQNAANPASMRDMRRGSVGLLPPTAAASRMALGGAPSSGEGRERRPRQRRTRKSNFSNDHDDLTLHEA